jgi:ABC-2 type transport system permease protein
MSLLLTRERNGGIKVKPMQQFKQMFLAQLKMTFREKQAWFWGIFFPVILMVIFMVIFTGNSDDEFKSKVAVVNENPNEKSEMMLAQLKKISVLEMEGDKTVSLKKAEKLVKEKEVEAAIVLPDSDKEASIKLIVNKENEQNVTTQAVSGILDKFVQQANLAAAGAVPVFSFELQSVSSGNNELNYTDFLLTGMIALAIAQGGLFGMVDLVEMRRKGLLKRLRMTPANMGLFGLSDMFMRLIFSLIQIVLLSLIGVLVFDAQLFINLISLIVVFIIGALSFNALGYLISSLSKTTEAYMGVANIVSFLMMFLSGVFFPVDTLPEWLQPVSNLLPLTYFAEGLRDSMVYDTGIGTGSLWLGLGNMVIWGGIAFMIGAWFYRRKSITSVR